MNKDFFKPIVALFTICLVASVLLSVTNFITKDKIAEASENAKTESLKEVFADAESFSDEADGEIPYYYALDGSGNKIGMVFVTSAKGYGGQVEVMTGVDKDGKVTKIKILSMSDETPGLGQNAQKPEFTEQFDGKQGTLSWVKQGKSETEIQGVTSATFTSKAVIDCVNRSLEQFSLLGGVAQ